MGKHEADNEKAAGRHRKDPRGFRCKAGFHRDVVVNTVHFSDDKPGVWHEIVRCVNCDRPSARLKK